MASDVLEFDDLAILSRRWQMRLHRHSSTGERFDAQIFLRKLAPLHRRP
jgi:hypothetical protein